MDIFSMKREHAAMVREHDRRKRRHDDQMMATQLSMDWYIAKLNAPLKAFIADIRNHNA